MPVKTIPSVYLPPFISILLNKMSDSESDILVIRETGDAGQVQGTTLCNRYGEFLAEKWSGDTLSIICSRSLHVGEYTNLMNALPCQHEADTTILSSDDSTRGIFYIVRWKNTSATFSVCIDLNKTPGDKDLIRTVKAMNRIIDL